MSYDYKKIRLIQHYRINDAQISYELKDPKLLFVDHDGLSIRTMHCYAMYKIYRQNPISISDEGDYVNCSNLLKIIEPVKVVITNDILVTITRYLRNKDIISQDYNYLNVSSLQNIFEEIYDSGTIPSYKKLYSSEQAFYGLYQLSDNGRVLYPINYRYLIESK